jgi:HprK-related kinase A
MSGAALPREVRAQVVAGSALLRVTIGPYRIQFDGGPLPQAVGDFAELYEAHQPRWLESDKGGDASLIRIRIEESRYSNPLRRRYSIFANDEVAFTQRRSREVLPYTEWAINSRIMRSDDQRLLIHAASVSRAGRSVILAAYSCGGKSTLTAALVARGWGYLCDEFAVIDCESLHAHPLPRAMCIKSGSFPIVRRLGLPLWQRRHYVKSFKGRVAYIRPSDLPNGAIGSPAPVRAVIFPEYHAAKQPSLVPMSRAEATMQLAELAFNAHRLGGQSVEMISQLVRGARCYRLRSGDIQATCDLLSTAIGSAQ